jgi:hypothetical protein
MMDLSLMGVLLQTLVGLNDVLVTSGYKLMTLVMVVIGCLYHGNLPIIYGVVTIGFVTLPGFVVVLVVEAGDVGFEAFVEKHSLDPSCSSSTLVESSSSLQSPYGS